MKKKKTFYVGDKIPRKGQYICVPCGYRATFNKGEIFPECISCLERQKDLEKEDLIDEGTWESVE